ncbi:Tn3 family transposase [Pseudobacteroides cellulosolvens]|uniref:Transposase Tn3 family protein n=1 Tax=Pseudobacteroides cellulosolvens ATCC 35603 = DSM 2933 TaxID=398512 RepID=A0A0L6JPG7_9FIRM|nr:Tn3 family transposase [Pseudobacteroides cellulosolvens]KNY27684.1 transposase Tn3 family protein [Pseudobacteroides cellulosolvens ATCC 35603 = DSM 2933]
MPVEFLTHEQEVKYGKFSEDPSPEQLAKYFWFDDKDKNAIFNHRHDYNRLGFALQLGTVRFLGTFLSSPIKVPANVISYVSQQLKIKPEVVSLYNSEKNTHNHRNEIRQIYEYHDFTSQPFHFRLIRWLYSRAWISAERPSVMFDLATARCVESKILLPGVTTLARLIAQVRDRASIRLWSKLGKLPSNDQLILLENLLETESGNRNTLLDILRQPPTTATPKGLLIAIDRLERLRLLGAMEWNLSGIPVGRLRVLSRYASMARAQTIERMNYERRIATLVSFAITFTISAQDDVIEIMEAIFTNIFRKSDNKGKKNRIRTIKDLDSAARRLREVCSYLLDESISDNNLREVIFTKYPKDILSSSLQMIDRLTKPADISVAHEELFRNYTNIRKILPSLLESLEFKATPSGQQALLSWNFLADSENKKGKAKYADAPLSGLTSTWKKLVLKNSNEKINPCAYTFWTIERMNDALKRHDIYVDKSELYCDPRAQLLQGEEWESVKPHVLRTLDWTSSAVEALKPLADELDRAYRTTSRRWDTNTAVRIENDRLILSPLDKLEEPKSLKKLRKQVQSLLPHIDLPELVLELNSWVPFLDAFTHISESNSRVDDLHISICAVLIARACNIGLEPVVQPGVPALEYDRLTWVEQNYFRTETITQANNILVAYHSKLGLAQILGSGEVASADGLRFVTPSKTINSGPNPKYFGVGRGVTYYNYTSDQFTGLHGIVIPGTIRDSLYLLELVLEQQTELQPKEIMTDTAGYSDIVFGLFGLLGYQFSPRLADIGSSKFWRIDSSADYGALNVISKNKIKTDLIIRYWDDFMRIAGSLMLGTVNPTQLIKALQHGGKPTMLGRAIGELGRIFKTKHNLTYIDDEAYRRKILTQLNRGESRHSLARAVWYGKKGELHQNYREGQEDQLGALGLIVNAIVIWNTRYMESALEVIRDRGNILEYEDIPRLSPLGYEHINIVGKYSFNLSETVANGKLRPLINIEEIQPQQEE